MSKQSKRDNDELLKVIFEKIGDKSNKITRKKEMIAKQAEKAAEKEKESDFELFAKYMDERDKSREEKLKQVMVAAVDVPKKKRQFKQKITPERKEQLIQQLVKAREASKLKRQENAKTRSEIKKAIIDTMKQEYVIDPKIPIPKLNDVKTQEKSKQPDETVTPKDDIQNKILTLISQVRKSKLNF